MLLLLLLLLHMLWINIAAYRWRRIVVVVVIVDRGRLLLRIARLINCKMKECKMKHIYIN